jgi:hypothetical protein
MFDKDSFWIQSKMKIIVIKSTYSIVNYCFDRDNKKEMYKFSIDHWRIFIFNSSSIVLIKIVKFNSLNSKRIMI